MTENCKLRKAILSAFYNISQRRKLWNITNFVMLFQAVMKFLSSSKFSLLRKWSISSDRNVSCLIRNSHHPNLDPYVTGPGPHASDVAHSSSFSRPHACSIHPLYLRFNESDSLWRQSILIICKNLQRACELVLAMSQITIYILLDPWITK
jgi:hypothetical protein